MGEPKSVIVWLNYNSRKILDVVLESLESVASLDYDNYVLLVVDNGSTDGSIEEIEKFIESNSILKHRTKVLKLGNNLGYTGAHNVAWKYTLIKHPDAKYFVFLNNDAKLTPHSLRALVEILESALNVSGAQGIIKIWGTNKIDCFGCFLDELLLTHPFLRGKRVEEAPKRSLPVTYVCGAYCVYRVKALKDIALKGNDLFPTHAFGYMDDVLLGVLSYMRGYSVIAVPVDTGEHYGTLTFRRYGILEYYTNRSRQAMISLSKTRYAKPYSAASIIKKAAVTLILARALSKVSRESSEEHYEAMHFKYAVRGMYDAATLKKIIEKHYGIKFSYERVPLIRLSPADVLVGLVRTKHLVHKVEERLKEIVQQCEQS